MNPLGKLFGRKDEPVDLTNAGPLARSLRKCKKCQSVGLLIDNIALFLISKGSSNRKHEHEWQLASERNIVNADYDDDELAYLKRANTVLKSLPGLTTSEARAIRIDCLSRIAGLEKSIPSNTIEALYYRTIKIYAEASAFDLAANEMEKAVVLEPDNLHHRNQLAVQYFLANNWQKAESIWTELLQQSPGDQDALTQYTNALVQMGKKDPSKKIIYYERALELHPRSQRFNLALGVFYQDASKWEKAISHFKETLACATEPMGGSASLSSFKAEVKDRMARCYSNLEKWGEAIKYWEESLAEKDWPPGEKRVVMSGLSNAQSHSRH